MARDRAQGHQRTGAGAHAHGRTSEGDVNRQAVRAGGSLEFTKHKERRRRDGSVHGTGVQAVPAGRAEALPEGHEVRHGEVPGGAAQLCAGAARARAGATSEDVGLRAAAAGEAEGQADLRGIGEVLQDAVRAGGEAAGRNGREPADRAGVAAGQRGVPVGLRREPEAVASAGAAPARGGERAAGGRAELPGAAGRRDQGTGGVEGSAARAGVAGVEDASDDGPLAGSG